MKLKLVFAAFLTVLALTSCGGDSELTAFRKNMDNFCTRISEIDSSINGIDPDAASATEELLTYLDELDLVFQSFAGMDFPDEFNYLENLADESSKYMTEAVKSYHDAFSMDSFDSYTAEYARENYSRAYKRVQIIISFLHGEEPTDPDLTVEYGND